MLGSTTSLFINDICPQNEFFFLNELKNKIIYENNKTYIFKCKTNQDLQCIVKRLYRASIRFLTFNLLVYITKDTLSLLFLNFSIHVLVVTRHWGVKSAYKQKLYILVEAQL